MSLPPTSISITAALADAERRISASYLADMGREAGSLSVESDNAITDQMTAET